jgi:hypothetical protein
VVRGYGLREINTCREVSLQNNFELPSIGPISKFFTVGDSGGPAVIQDESCPTATLLGITRY